MQLPVHTPAIIDEIVQQLFHSDDLHIRSFTNQEGTGHLLYFHTLVDQKLIDDYWLRPLLLRPELPLAQLTTSSTIHMLYDTQSAAEQLLSGYVLVISAKATLPILAIHAAQQKERAIEEPKAEKLIQGPRTGFVETAVTNLNLLRNLAQTKDIAVKEIQVGGLKKKSYLVYRSGVAPETLLADIRERIARIPKEAPISIGLLEEWLEDTDRSLFPLFLKTERPDQAVAQLMRGKALLICDGTPLTLVMPASLFTFFQTMDDYNFRWIPASALRLLRFLGFVIALILPGIYIGIMTYHFEVLPTDLVLQVKGSLESVPFPPLIEALFMGLTIEFIVEAGIRMPTGIGQIIGIVGGLVIGDAVVKAGLVSDLMIIVIALTAVCTYLIPSQELNATVRILRNIISVFSAWLGFYGLMFALVLILIHLCRLESFRQPYLHDISDSKWSTLAMLLFRPHAKQSFTSKHPQRNKDASSSPPAKPEEEPS